MTTALAPSTVPGLATRAAVLCWHELPRSLAAGGAWLAATVPLLLAALAGAPGWILALAAVPPALVLTGLAAFAATVARGDGPRLALLRRVDPVLALLLAGGAGLAALGLTAGGPAALAGGAGGAVLLLVAPYALAYGALRDRRGLAALRGGAILVAFRPAWAFALVVLAGAGGLLAVASAGILAVVVLPLLLAVASAMTAALLDEIDALQGRA
ncbi:hypothetical protein ACFO1B_15640 [Dactylosporangium siamense]|uniref:Uncharacterized protein n=1 Tax=Dactylosporangium siamense TaxID=685454 RepID=A0A919PI69_9ACTN|nr:hypothetical protein [Dactylosporangium siamense]GIG45271.1 hypothetical protein Dsi01nite_033120 [Dactylosporangium siamense]